ncbi:MAG: zinc ribbon-containing protein [Gammaproteobacteria bacterium]
MKKPIHVDPLDALGAAYETMYERVAKNLHNAKEHTGPLLHKFIDEARDKAVELDELTEEDAEKLTDWLKRDLDDAISHIAETDEKLTDWLGFETTLIESALLYLLLETADKTTVELLQLKQNAERPYIYHTGEVTGPGTLICDQCDEVLHFHKAGKIPPCPRCHETQFHREGKKVSQN